MIIQGIRITRSERRAHECEIPESAQRNKNGPPPDECAVSDYMLNVREGIHDRNIANYLGIASSWSYSDIDTFARMMARRLMPCNEIVGVTDANPALFVDTTAYLVQSADRKLALLAFRGTGLKNTVNWLTDVSARPDPFFTAGRVHGGFLRATLVLWPTLSWLLKAAAKGDSICEAARQEKNRLQDYLAEYRHCDEGTEALAASRELTEAPRDPGQAPAPVGQGELEALYITGHSLGGALAVVAAALLHADPSLDGIRRKLRGVYTYGQPMVGYSDFATRFDEEFGRKLFRHVYGMDVVPRLPPRTTGKFVHFGREYGSTDEGWMYRSVAASQVHTFVGSTIIGVLAWIQMQLSGLPLFQLLPKRYSWSDHSPLNYLRTSQSTPVGAEFS